MENQSTQDDMVKLKRLAARLRDNFIEEASQLDMPKSEDNDNACRPIACIGIFIVGFVLLCAGAGMYGGIEIFICIIGHKLEKLDPQIIEKMAVNLSDTATKAAAGTAEELLGTALAAFSRGGVNAARASTTPASPAACVEAATTAGSTAVNLVLIGLTVDGICGGALDLHKQKGRYAGDYLRKLAQSLDQFSRQGLSTEYLLSSSSLNDYPVPGVLIV